MKLTTKQAWLEIAHMFERFHELDYRSFYTSSGLCKTIALVNTDGEACLKMSDQLRAYGNKQKNISQYWFPCSRAAAGERALIAYFLAEMGDEIL